VHVAAQPDQKRRNQEGAGIAGSVDFRAAVRQ
jgi:hypothetical protein